MLYCSLNSFQPVKALNQSAFVCVVPHRDEASIEGVIFALFFNVCSDVCMYACLGICRLLLRHCCLFLRQ